MPYAITIGLILLWLLALMSALMSSATLGGFIHVLLVMAVITVFGQGDRRAKAKADLTAGRADY